MRITRIVVLCGFVIIPLAMGAGEAPKDEMFFAIDEEGFNIAELASANLDYQEAGRSRQEATRAREEAAQAFEESTRLYREAMTRERKAQEAQKVLYQRAFDNARNERKEITFDKAFERECFICYLNFRDKETFSNDQKIVRTECGHMMGAECFDNAKGRKNECRMCRKKNPQTDQKAGELPFPMIGCYLICLAT